VGIAEPLLLRAEAGETGLTVGPSCQRRGKGRGPKGEEVGRSRVGSGREGSWARRGEGGPANGLWGGFGFLLSYFYFFSFFYF